MNENIQKLFDELATKANSADAVNKAEVQTLYAEIKSLQDKQVEQEAAIEAATEALASVPCADEFLIPASHSSLKHMLQTRRAHQVRLPTTQARTSTARVRLAPSHAAAHAYLLHTHKARIA